MFLVGLTGGIAAGKSTVAKRLALHGAVTIDADDLAKKAVEIGTPALGAIAQLWPAAINVDGSLNRAALGEIVFSSIDARQQLESIVHPEVRRLAQEFIAQHREASVIVYVVPLLIEVKVDLPFDFIVTVEADDYERERRLVTSRGLDPQQAKARIAAQANPSERKAIADEVINADASESKMLEQVDQLWNRLKSLAQGKLERG